MSDINQITEVVKSVFGVNKVFTASVGGSGTFALDTVGIGFPESLSCAGPQSVIARFQNTQTPFGYIPWVKLIEVDHYPVLRIPYHGWHLPSCTIEDTLAVFWLLNQLETKQVVIDASVGGIKAKPWDIVLPDDVITNDPTKLAMTPLAKALGKDPWVRMLKPFCSRIRDISADCSQRLKDEGTEEPHHPIGDVVIGGTYITTPLSVFETTAEIRTFAKDPSIVVVGQSSGQEAIAARICGMCIQVINPVANYAEGLSNATWTPGGMEAFYDEVAIPMAVIVYWVLERLVGNQNRSCECANLAIDANLAKFTHPPSQSSL